MLGLVGVQPEAERDEHDDAAAEQESALAFEAGLAEQTFEGTIGHRILPRQGSAGDAKRSLWVYLDCTRTHIAMPTSVSVGTSDKMRRASGQRDLFDRRLAAQARFAGSAIDAEFVLHLPLEPGAADVIANAGAALVDGARQHRDDRRGAALGLLAPSGRLAEQRRMEPGLEERFVGVNVADAGDDRLIEQDRLEIALGRLQRLRANDCASRSNGSGPRPIFVEECCSTSIRGWEESHAAETADIAETQLVAVVQREDDVRMRFARSSAATTVNWPVMPRWTSSHGSPSSSRIHLPRRSMACTRWPSSCAVPGRATICGAALSAHGDLHERAAHEQRPQIADDRFHFGQFRHDVSSCNGRRCYNHDMPNAIQSVPDQHGRFGPYGGRYVPETLMHALRQLTEHYDAARADPEFQKQLDYYLRHYVGRPSPLYFAERLTQVRRRRPHFPQARGSQPHRRPQDQQLHRPGAADASAWASRASSPRPAPGSTAWPPRRRPPCSASSARSTWARRTCAGRSSTSSRCGRWGPKSSRVTQRQPDAARRHQRGDARLDGVASRTPTTSSAASSARTRFR